MKESHLLIVFIRLFCFVFFKRLNNSVPSVETNSCLSKGLVVKSIIDCVLQSVMKKELAEASLVQEHITEHYLSEITVLI